MKVDQRVAAVQLSEHRRDARIPRPHVAEIGGEPDAVDPQDIERILDLAQRALDIRQGQCCEHAEPPG